MRSLQGLLNNNTRLHQLRRQLPSLEDVPCDGLGEPLTGACKELGALVLGELLGEDPGNCSDAGLCNNADTARKRQLPLDEQVEARPQKLGIGGARLGRA